MDAVVANESLKSRRGRTPLEACDKRTHTVSVRLNNDELAHLDAARGDHQRGEWMRMAGLDRLPPSVPEVNREAWIALSRAASNLNQIARAINSREAPAVQEIRIELLAFRDALLGAKS